MTGGYNNISFFIQSEVVQFYALRLNNEKNESFQTNSNLK